MWMLLFFGWSIAGAVAGFLVTQLGFPYLWVTPFTLLMFGAMFFLAYRGYSVQTWMLAGCIGFILISIMAIARGLIISDPNIPDIYVKEFEAVDEEYSVLGMDIPYYDEGSFDYFIDYDPERDTYLIGQGYDVRMPITVEFAPMQTAGSQWAFQSGSVDLQGRFSGIFDADPEQNWLNDREAKFVADRPLREVRPQLTVDIPLSSGTARSLLDVDATMTIIYPDETGAVETATLNRSFSLQTIGSDYYQHYEKYVNWKRTRSVVKMPILPVLILGSVFAGAGCIYLVRQGALHSRTSGSGLQFVMRRLSAEQKFGAELYDPRKYPDLTDSKQGVFVGRVTAQSPAGRAGLRTGDILLQLADQPVNTPGAINRIVRSRKKGDIVSATILHDGQPVDLRVRF